MWGAFADRRATTRNGYVKNALRQIFFAIFCARERRRRKSRWQRQTAVKKWVAKRRTGFVKCALFIAKKSGVWRRRRHSRLVARIAREGNSAAHKVETGAYGAKPHSACGCAVRGKAAKGDEPKSGETFEGEGAPFAEDLSADVFDGEVLEVGCFNFLDFFGEDA